MSAIEISVSGLLAQGRRIDTISRNISNTNNIESGNAIPVDTVTISQQNGGVTTGDIADPNASIDDQVIGLLATKTNYEANIKVIKAQDEMDKALLDIIT